MKSIFVSDLRPSQDVTSVFLVAAKEVRQKKSGEPFLSLSLADKTGDIDAKMWDNVGEVMQTFDRDDFIKVKGRVQVYQNKPQLTVHRLVRFDEAEVEFADFFPASDRNPDQMFTELRGIVAAMGNPHLKTLLEAVLDDEDIAHRYKEAPAAKSVHHAYLGGLLEHVLSLCGLSRMMAQHYPLIDLDLMLAGCVLHDIGKIHELSYRRSFGYTDDGQLLGHIIIGLRMIGDKLRDLPDFPPRLRSLVEHIVISHHGTLEFGSPKIPVFPEALLFHYLDNVDSKMENMRAALERDQQMEGNWSSYNRPLERILLKKDKYLTGEQDTPAPPLATAPGPSSAAAHHPPAGRSEQPSLFGSKLQDALRKEP